MKIAVFGGSFDPVHIGHLAVADDVCKRLSYDRVIFVPSFNPPHKELSGFSSQEDRLNMLKLSVEDNPRFEVSDIEIKRGGTSYTYDTILQLKEIYGSELEEKPGLILGSDLFSGFHLWHRAEELASMCTLILARRNPEAEEKSRAKGSYALLDSEEFKPENETLFKDAVYISNPYVNISSSSIREAVKNNFSFRYLVNKKVFDYITEHGLYADNR